MLFLNAIGFKNWTFVSSTKFGFNFYSFPTSICIIINNFYYNNFLTLKKRELLNTNLGENQVLCINYLKTIYSVAT